MKLLFSKKYITLFSSLILASCSNNQDVNYQYNLSEFQNMCGNERVVTCQSLNDQIFVVCLNMPTGFDKLSDKELEIFCNIN